MKKYFFLFLVVPALVVCVLLGHAGSGLGIEKEKDMKIEKYDTNKSADDCGGLEFNKTTGGMIRKPNVDLVVAKIEIIRNDRGVWVIPWIKNRCPGIITEDIHVSVGEVVVTFAGLTPQVASSLGHAVRVSSASSYTVVVDYDRRIAETNDSNNSCTRASTGNCL